jgi:hypothetical protein
MQAITSPGGGGSRERAGEYLMRAKGRENVRCP